MNNEELTARLLALEETFKQHQHKQYDGSKKMEHNGLFIGHISAGTSVFLPPGWTSEKIAAGDYKITHNLGTTKYAFVGTVTAVNQDFIVMVKDQNANYTEIITTKADAGAATDCQVLFFIMKYK